MSVNINDLIHAQFWGNNNNNNTSSHLLSNSTLYIFIYLFSFHYHKVASHLTDEEAEAQRLFQGHSARWKMNLMEDGPGGQFGSRVSTLNQDANTVECQYLLAIVTCARYF